MNVVNSKRKALVKTDIVTLGTATTLTLGGGGYHSESSRPKSAYGSVMANLGKATQITLGGGN